MTMAMTMAITQESKPDQALKIFLSPLLRTFLSLEERGLIQSYLGLNAIKSFTLYTLSSCRSMCYSHLIKKLLV